MSDITTGRQRLMAFQLGCQEHLEFKTFHSVMGFSKFKGICSLCISIVKYFYMVSVLVIFIST